MSSALKSVATVINHIDGLPLNRYRYQIKYEHCHICITYVFRHADIERHGTEKRYSDAFRHSYHCLESTFIQESIQIVGKCIRWSFYLAPPNLES